MNKHLLQGYCKLIFDGLGFFDFDELKLNRLKGVKPSWTDKFKNTKWVFKNLVYILMIAYVLHDQILDFGIVKSHELKTEIHNEYGFNVTE